MQHQPCIFADVSAVVMEVHPCPLSGTRQYVWTMDQPNCCIGCARAPQGPAHPCEGAAAIPNVPVVLTAEELAALAIAGIGSKLLIRAFAAF